MMGDKLKQYVKSSELLYFGERGSGPPLLLVHGLMATGEMFEPVTKQLASQYHLIIPDLRGHGQSRKLPPPYTPVQMASDLASLLDHLGIESAMVLGDSMGGAIAQQFVLDYPKRCSRLILASTYTYNFVTFGEKIIGHLIPFVVRFLGLRQFGKLVTTQGTKQLSKERADWLAGLIAGQDIKVMLSALRETVIRFDSRSRLAEIKCPTLIVVGPLDHGDLRQAKMLHDGITGSQLVIINNADHALMWGHTDEFLQSVEEFLKG
jgi:pimeloyl-ACP methyl ester carboxylesterase